MSIFKKLLASVGIGAAKVDTRLDNDAIIPGEMINGEVHIQGGDIYQEIADIYLYIATEYKREIDDNTVREKCVLVKYRLSEHLGLKPNSTEVIPFSIQLPYETPLTIGHQPVYLQTGLDISLAIDPQDTDYIQVLPHPLMQAVLDALNNLGFQLHQVDCEYNPHWGNNYPFVQEFEFRPFGNYRSSLDELEVIFSLHADALEVFLELDRRARGLGGFLAEAFDLDERYTRFRVTPDSLNNLPELEGIIDHIIQTHAR